MARPLAPTFPVYDKLIHHTFLLPTSAVVRVNVVKNGSNAAGIETHEDLGTLKETQDGATAVGRNGARPMVEETDGKKSVEERAKRFISDVVLCHNDLLSGNILYADGWDRVQVSARGWEVECAKSEIWGRTRRIGRGKRAVRSLLNYVCLCVVARCEVLDADVCSAGLYEIDRRCWNRYVLL